MKVHSWIFPIYKKIQKAQHSVLRLLYVMMLPLPIILLALRKRALS